MLKVCAFAASAVAFAGCSASSSTVPEVGEQSADQTAVSWPAPCEGDNIGEAELRALSSEAPALVGNYTMVARRRRCTEASCSEWQVRPAVLMVRGRLVTRRFETGSVVTLARDKKFDGLAHLDFETKEFMFRCSPKSYGDKALEPSCTWLAGGNLGTDASEVFIQGLTESREVVPEGEGKFRLVPLLFGPPAPLRPFDDEQREVRLTKSCVEVRTSRTVGAEQAEYVIQANLSL